MIAFGDGCCATCISGGGINGGGGAANFGGGASGGTDIWRVLADAHDVRNSFEYEGSDEVTEDLGNQVVRCAKVLEKLV